MIPSSHPRYESLMIREKLARGFKEGLVHETGLIAHGRGEAYDYLLGETTIPTADKAAQVAAHLLVTAKNPVISINGNVAALAAKDCCILAETVGAKLEVNLFHHDKKRMKKIADVLQKNGATGILGLKADKKIPGLDHPRAMCCRQGIFQADTILVALEDGDRCRALLNMDKTVIAIDLNPLSRTAQTASVTIVDNVIRAIPHITDWADKMRTHPEEHVQDMGFDNQSCLQETLHYISHRLITWDKNKGDNTPTP